MQKLTLLKHCWVGDLYRSYFCLSPSPRLVHGTVSNRTFSYIFFFSLQSVAGILLVACCKKKRKQKATSSHFNPTYNYTEPRPTTETVTSHANPIYDVSDYRPESQSENPEYSIPDRIALSEWSKSQSDLAEQSYDDIGNKGLMEEFADDPKYDCLEPSQGENHPLSFTNLSYHTSSDT